MGACLSASLLAQPMNPFKVTSSLPRIQLKDLSRKHSTTPARGPADSTRDEITSSASMKTWSVQHPVQGSQVEQLDVVELYSTAACHQPASYPSRHPCGGPYPSLKELSFILTAGTATLCILETMQEFITSVVEL